MEIVESKLKMLSRKQWVITYFGTESRHVSKPMKFKDAVFGLSRFRDYAIEKSKIRKPHKWQKGMVEI